MEEVLSVRWGERGEGRKERGEALGEARREWASEGAVKYSTS
jgi:hypothetical protein